MSIQRTGFIIAPPNHPDSPNNFKRVEKQKEILTNIFNKETSWTKGWGALFAASSKECGAKSETTGFKKTADNFAVPAPSLKKTKKQPVLKNASENRQAIVGIAPTSKKIHKERVFTNITPYLAGNKALFTNKGVFITKQPVFEKISFPTEQGGVMELPAPGTKTTKTPQIN